MESRPRIPENNIAALAVPMGERGVLDSDMVDNGTGVEGLSQVTLPSRVGGAVPSQDGVPPRQRGTVSFQDDEPPSQDGNVSPSSGGSLPNGSTGGASGARGELIDLADNSAPLIAGLAPSADGSGEAASHSLPLGQGKGIKMRHHHSHTLPLQQQIHLDSSFGIHNSDRTALLADLAARWLQQHQHEATAWKMQSSWIKDLHEVIRKGEQRQRKRK